jgi:hypothetical protein
MFDSFDCLIGMILIYLFFKGLDLIADCWCNARYAFYKWNRKRKGPDE